VSYAVAWFLVMSGIVAYLAPALVALCREVPNQGSVIVVDVLLGWTLAGWVISLAMAVRSKAESVESLRNLSTLTLASRPRYEGTSR
jgi:hypothetical protein